MFTTLLFDITVEIFSYLDMKDIIEFRMFGKEYRALIIRVMKILLPKQMKFYKFRAIGLGPTLRWLEYDGVDDPRINLVDYTHADTIVVSFKDCFKLLRSKISCRRIRITHEQEIKLSDLNELLISLSIYISENEDRDLTIGLSHQHLIFYVSGIVGVKFQFYHDSYISMDSGYGKMRIKAIDAQSLPGYWLLAKVMKGCEFRDIEYSRKFNELTSELFPNLTYILLDRPSIMQSYIKLAKKLPFCSQVTSIIIGAGQEFDGEDAILFMNILSMDNIKSMIIRIRSSADVTEFKKSIEDVRNRVTEEQYKKITFLQFDRNKNEYRLC